MFKKKNYLNSMCLYQIPLPPSTGVALINRHKGGLPHKVTVPTLLIITALKHTKQPSPEGGGGRRGGGWGEMGERWYGAVDNGWEQWRGKKAEVFQVARVPKRLR